MHLPNIQRFSTIADYLRDFLETNRNHNAKFSHRYFSKKLDWPPSYFADLIAGRKRMTLSRALEFSAFVKMDRFHTERLIQMTLADSDDTHVKGYFQKQLQSVAEEISEHDTTKATVDEIFSEPELALLFEFYLWSQRQYPAETIRSMLPYHSHLTPERIETLTKELEQKGMLVLEPDGRVRMLTSKLISSDHERENERMTAFHEEMVQTYAKIWNITLRPRAFFSGRIQLPKDRFEEVQKEVFRLKNWILEFGAEARTSAADTSKENILCQFGGYVFPLVDQSS